MTKGNQSNGTVLVIFGATGNLVQNKLLPAIYHLLKGDLVPNNFEIIFVSRNPEVTKEDILKKVDIQPMRKGHENDKEVVSLFKKRSRIIHLDSEKPEDFFDLKKMLDEIDIEKGAKLNHLYYLAIPPSIFKGVLMCLANAGLNKETNGVSRRILVEKPFGTDLASAKDLISFMKKYFDESQVYRIDHYLAKETAQNLLTFRFSNPLIEGLWNRQFIDYIQITASEEVDIEGRAVFYEGMGALRDLIQSHLLQLMALTMMEVPHPMSAKDLHKEKLLLLKSIRPIKRRHVDEVAIRGQYKGYRHEVNNARSNVETYAAVHLMVDNARWGGVPILLRTGKALKEKTTEITVVFKDRTRRKIKPNMLTIRIQPNEGIGISLLAKKPGLTEGLQSVNMDFCYQTAFQDIQPDAYEKVLIDAIMGDQSLFATSDEVLRCWKILQPILSVWEKNGKKLYEYNKGTWGPEKATKFAKSHGCEWLLNTSHVCEIHTSSKMDN
jgi:glucose-6-phosphate 1-dehydrogenase